MPFKSEAQRSWMHANFPEMAARWERHTPNKRLPKRKSKRPTANIITLMRKKRKNARLTRNAFCPTGPGGGIDPTCSPYGATVFRGEAKGGSGSGLAALGTGTYYGLSEKVAQRFSKSGTVKSSFVELKKPLIIRSDEDMERIKKQAEADTGLDFGKKGNLYVGMLLGDQPKQFTEWAKSKGHDGVVTTYKEAPGGEQMLVFNARRLPINRVIRIDPTRTTSLRMRFMSHVRRRFALLKGDIVRKLVKEDALGILADRRAGLKANAQDWRFSSDPEKVRKFQAWLKRQLQARLRGKTEDELWRRYVEEGFKRGAGRAFDDVRRAERDLAASDKRKLDFYEGSRHEFLRSSFGRPESVDKVKLLASRNFDELDGITERMGLRMTRTLTDGLVEGKHPNDIARDLAGDIDIERTRAETIARTEIVRAHAEGQLTALEQLGVEEVGVMVEWATAGDEHVCPACLPLEGVVLKIEEAHNMIPRHPNCRCAFLPANVGEDKDEQQRSKGEIVGAIRESLEEGGDWPGSEKDISKQRPESVLNEFSRAIHSQRGGTE